MDDKMMDLTEFQAAGYLQEVNRLFFHRLGLALVMMRDDEAGLTTIIGIRDAREDPEGMVFGYDNPERTVNAARVAEELSAHDAVRLARFGWAIQPPDVAVEAE